MTDQKLIDAGKKLTVTVSGGEESENAWLLEQIAVLVAGAQRFFVRSYGDSMKVWVPTHEQRKASDERGDSFGKKDWLKAAGFEDFKHD